MMDSKTPKVIQDTDGTILGEIGSGNVFADLGFSNPEDESAKAKIVRKIQKVIDQRGLTQAQAGAIIGLPQGKLSKLLRGKWDSDYSVDRLTRYLNKLGVSVVYSFEDETDWHEGRLLVASP
jgi:predicted XRE-type DNA-binding protein